MQSFYDYTMCRTGPRPTDKARNFIINVHACQRLVARGQPKRPRKEELAVVRHHEWDRSETASSGNLMTMDEDDLYYWTKTILRRAGINVLRRRTSWRNERPHPD